MIDHEHRDVLQHFEATLTAARAEAAAAVERATAATDLRNLALELAARAELTFVTQTQLFDLPADEDERARLQSLVLRALPIDNDEGEHR